MSARKRAPGTFGTVETLPSGRHRARYRGPDGRRYTAPTLFLAKKDARAWLSLQQAEIIRDTWQPPTTRKAMQLTFENYADTWMKQRDLKIRTREHYERLLEDHLLPAFGDRPISIITVDDVRTWHADFGTTRPTLRSHCYGLLRTIMGTAVSDGKITLNPCQIRGAGSVRRVHKIRPATLDEIATITEAMPPQYRTMVLLAAWGAMRFGELTELRRADMTIVIANDPDDSYGIARVDRGVVRSKAGFRIGDPKSDAGRRDVEIPPHLLPAIQSHLDDHVGPNPDALLFPAKGGQHLAPASLYRHYYPARAAAGRKDLRWHDLRHSGAVLAAATGATLAELMGRLGHSTPSAAMKYQHAAQGRDRQIAKLLSGLVSRDTVVRTQFRIVTEL